MTVEPFGILPLAVLVNDATEIDGFEARRILAAGAIKTLSAETATLAMPRACCPTSRFQACIVRLTALHKGTIACRRLSTLPKLDLSQSLCFTSAWIEGSQRTFRTLPRVVSGALASSSVRIQRQILWKCPSIKGAESLRLRMQIFLFSAMT